MSFPQSKHKQYDENRNIRTCAEWSTFISSVNGRSTNNNKQLGYQFAYGSRLPGIWSCGVNTFRPRISTTLRSNNRHAAIVLMVRDSRFAMKMLRLYKTAPNGIIGCEVQADTVASCSRHPQAPVFCVRCELLIH